MDGSAIGSDILLKVGQDPVGVMGYIEPFILPVFGVVFATFNLVTYTHSLPLFLSSFFAFLLLLPLSRFLFYALEVMYMPILDVSAVT